jgi:excisionase family DNA binding protein
MQDQTLPIPNPGDWLSATQACAIANVGRSTIYQWIKSGVLTRYEVAGSGAFWRPEVHELRDAIARVRRP